MELKRCPNCGKVDTSGFGFCVYCGTEFDDKNPSETIEVNDKFSKYVEDDLQNNPNNSFNRNQNYNDNRDYQANTTQNQYEPRSTKMSILIILGYLLAIFGSFIGIIVVIYLLTRKDPDLKRHGVIQLAILAFYAVLLIAMFASGALDLNTMEQIGQMEVNNITQMMK